MKILINKLVGTSKRLDWSDPVKTMRAIAARHEKLKEFWGLLQAGKYEEAKDILLKVAGIKGNKQNGFVSIFTGSPACSEYFGSHITALIDSFPELLLKQEDFSRKDWTNSKETMRTIAANHEKLKEFWSLLQANRYEEAKKELIRVAGKLGNKQSGFVSVFTNTPTKSIYFGSHITALMESFSELGLKQDDFSLKDWTDPIKTMRAIAASHEKLKEFWDLLQAGKYEKAKTELIRIVGTRGDKESGFVSIFTGTPINRQNFGSHITALVESFPELEFTETDLRFNNWANPKETMRTIAANHEKLKEFWSLLQANRYEEAKKELIRVAGKLGNKESGFINIFTGTPTLSNYFGSHITALMESFSELGLKQDDFSLKDWTDPIKTMRAIAASHEKLKEFWSLLQANRYEEAKKELIRVTGKLGDKENGFVSIFTSTPIKSRNFGSYIKALIKSFPELGLIKEDFSDYQLSGNDWKNPKETMRTIAANHEKLKEFWSLLQASKYEEAKAELLRIADKQGDKQSGFVSIFTNTPTRPKYFGSYIKALIESFPELNIQYHDFGMNDYYVEQVQKFLQENMVITEIKNALVVSFGKAHVVKIPTRQGELNIFMSHLIYKKALFYPYEKNGERKVLIFEYKGSEELKDYQPSEMIGYMYVDESGEIKLERKK